MSRKYVTGWFSPTDPDLMVMFYQIDPGPVFEAEVVKSSGVVQTFSDSNLGRLQADVTNRCGGDFVRSAPLVGAPPLKRVTWSKYLSRSNPVLPAK